MNVALRLACRSLKSGLSNAKSVTKFSVLSYFLFGQNQRKSKALIVSNKLACANECGFPSLLYIKVRLKYTKMRPNSVIDNLIIFEAEAMRLILFTKR
jgi:hypothetical protein